MRTATFNSKKNIVKHLQSAENLSRYLAIQLVEQGYMDAKSIKGEGRGRPSIEYVVSKKGENLLRLSQYWKQSA